MITLHERWTGRYWNAPGNGKQRRTELVGRGRRSARSDQALEVGGTRHGHDLRARIAKRLSDVAPRSQTLGLACQASDTLCKYSIMSGRDFSQLTHGSLSFYLGEADVCSGSDSVENVRVFCCNGASVDAADGSPASCPSLGVGIGISLAILR